MEILDVAYILDKVVPAANYSGSLTANDENAYNSILWNDTREKPSWACITSYAGEFSTWDAVNGKWTINENAKIKDARKAKQYEIVSKADAELSAQSVEYGDGEKATWDQQYAEAIAYQADTNASVPLLNAIAAARGMNLADLTNHIVANRAAWAATAGSIVGQRLAYQDALEAATTISKIESINVEYTLPK